MVVERRRRVVCVRIGDGLTAFIVGIIFLSLFLQGVRNATATHRRRPEKLKLSTEESIKRMSFPERSKAISAAVRKSNGDSNVNDNGKAEAMEPGLLHIPRSAHTLAGFREWVLSDEFPEKLPVAFIRGEVYLDMSKEAIRTHAAVKTPVAVTLGNLNQEIDFGDLYINGVLVTNVSAQVSNNPDMVAVFWESLEAGRVRYVTKKVHEMEIEGSPDWALEIVSDSSVVKDLQQLRQVYHEAGIREYWLIDARGDEIMFQILHWRKSGYFAAPHKDGWLRSRVFGREFRLNRKPDRRGAWKYELQVRA